MNYLKKHKIKKIIYGIVGLVIIPVYSYIYSKAGPGDGLMRLIMVTFSQIGARYGKIENLIIWGIMTSAYYYSLLSYILSLTKVRSFFIKFSLGVTCGSMLLTVFLPFAPEIFPITSEVHTFLGYVTAVATVITMYALIFKYLKHDKQLFVRSFISLTMIMVICILVLLAYGVSSLFQIVIVVGLCLFLLIQLFLLEKSTYYDVFVVLEVIEEEKSLEFR